MTDWLDAPDEGDNYFPKKEKEIDIPDFLNKGLEIPDTNQLMQEAVLGNVPGNQETEEKNHLAQLEIVAKNYSSEEWTRILYHAPSQMMSDELKRRLITYEVYMNSTRDALTTLTSQKL